MLETKTDLQVQLFYTIYAVMMIAVLTQDHNLHPVMEEGDSEGDKEVKSH